MFFQRRTPPTYQALGIWDPARRQDYEEYLDRYGVTPNLTARKHARQESGKATTVRGGRRTTDKPRRGLKTRKRWGLLLVAGSVITFLVLQIIVSLTLLAGYTVAFLAATTHETDPQVIQKALYELLNNPAAITKLITNFQTWLQVTPAALYTLQACLYLPWILFMVYATRRRGLRNFRKEFWFRFKKYDILWGIIIAIGLNLAVALLQWLLSLIPGVSLAGSDNGQALFQTHGIWLYITAFGIGGLLGPLFEELYFRGFIMQGFIRHFRHGLATTPATPMGRNLATLLPGGYNIYRSIKRFLYHHKYSLAVILTAIFFGAMHTQLPPGGQAWTLGYVLVPVITGSLGLVLGFIAVKTKRLGINIFTHMAYNTIGIMLTLLSAGFLHF